ncbi:MAG: hypothetical protein EA398_00040 [Deltaproteobacteria bacterium]|nr:MAG: hypothetical protein EA398_00040 [Deltaproteobacteria bacterium]
MLMFPHPAFRPPLLLTPVLAGALALSLVACGDGGPSPGCDPGDLDCSVFSTPSPTDDATAFERAPGCAVYGTPRQTGRLPTGLVEASGLVRSAWDPGRLWVHNDSNNPAELFAIATDGTLLARIDMPVGNRDWEDIARGPCDENDAQGRCIYLGEIGDNNATHPWIEVYRFREPQSLDGVTSLSRSQIEIMRVRYPDGPRDAEAMWVDTRQNVWIASKEPGGLTRLYTIPFRATVPEQIRVLTFVDQFLLRDVLSEEDARTQRVTAADFEAETGRVIFRTRDFAFEFALAGRPLTRLFNAPVRTVPAADEPQGEAIAWGPNGGYYHTSEGPEARPLLRALRRGSHALSTRCSPLRSAARPSGCSAQPAGDPVVGTRCSTRRPEAP